MHKKSIKMHFDEIVHLLKERRKVLRITQEDLAGLSGIGLRTLKAIESGKGNPTLATLHKLAEVLGMEVIIRVKQPQL